MTVQLFSDESADPSGLVQLFGDESADSSGFGNSGSDGSGCGPNFEYGGNALQMQSSLRSGGGGGTGNSSSSSRSGGGGVGGKGGGSSNIYMSLPLLFPLCLILVSCLESHPQRCRCLIISDVVVLALVLSIALALTFVIGPISSRHDLRNGGAGQTARQRAI